MLRQIEHKIESLFEGIFGRAFRTHVQPVELARKLAKEMDDGKTVSVSRVYVPNEYSIYLAPDDRRQFDSYEDSLVDELQQYLAEHARREEYALLSSPRVVFNTDEDLAVGEFGIATRMVQPPGAAKAKDGPPSATMIYRPTRQPTEAATPAELGIPEPPPPPASLHIGGRKYELARERTVLGRSRDSDVQLADPGASRRHAEVRREGDAFWIVDLGSTNGMEVNGRRLRQAKLEDGDRITIGSTEIDFERGLP